MKAYQVTVLIPEEDAVETVAKRLELYAAWCRKLNDLPEAIDHALQDGAYVAVAEAKIIDVEGIEDDVFRS